MMPRRLPPSDDIVRAALNREPRAGLAADVFRDVTGALARMPQRPVRWTLLPWVGGLTETGPARGRRPNDTLVLLVVLALLIVSLVVAVGLIGALRDHRGDLGLAKPGLIGFDSGGHIVVANPDGSGRRQLTFGSATDMEPMFSPDGTRLAYLSLDPVAKKVQLIVMNTDGGDRKIVATTPARIVTSGALVGFLRVSWSPDGQWLAYTALVGGSPQILVTRVDGSDSTPVSPAGLDGQDPAWSPDGTQITFRGGHFDDERGIYVIGAGGAGLRRMTPRTDASVDFNSEFSPPAWSHRGDQIAYAYLSALSPSHIFVIGVGGGMPRDLSATPSDDWAPAWAPDGTRIAWLRGRSTTDPGQFVVAQPDGSAAITLPPMVVGTPIWSPDGTQLIGLVNDPATGYPDHLLIIDIATGSSVTVAAQAGGDPSWQRILAP